MKFRIWMPLVAVLVILLSVGITIFYGISVSRARLEDRAEKQLAEQAAAAAAAIEAQGTRDQQPLLEQAAEASDGAALLVDRNGRVKERAGSGRLTLASSTLQELSRDAARGRSVSQEIEGLDVSVAPVIRANVGAAGVVLISEELEDSIDMILLRSILEGAGVTSVLGGGLALLLATLLSRRVERLALGARAVQRGDLSYRLRAGFGDELGELAATFNTMAARLQASIARLESNNETLGAVLDNLTEGVLLTDLDGRVVFANHAARATLGIGEELPGEIPDPWGEFSLREAVSRCLEGREHVEARVRGREAFLHVKLYCLPESDEREDGALVVIQDLSEGQKLEENQQRFLANAAHEFKTPVTAIVGAAELLVTDGEDAATRRRFLDHILGEGQRLQRLSDTMLRLARTGLDQRQPELESVDLAETAREVTERMEPFAGGVGPRLCVDGKGDRVCADPEWLEQALMILVDNAIKHSDETGEVKLRVEGGSVVVEDEGAGIDEAELPHVFERLYRRKGGAEGFGLGLPICKKLVEGMGGEISISSRRGVGTAVEIELPEADADAE